MQILDLEPTQDAVTGFLYAARRVVREAANIPHDFKPVVVKD